MSADDKDIQDRLERIRARVDNWERGEVLAMENARLLTSAQGWRTAYENVRDENRAVTHLGGIRGEDS